MAEGPRPMKRTLPWIVPLTILLVWQVASQVGLLADQIMPAPTAVAAAFWRVTTSGELLRDIGVSTGRASVGFAIGGGIGFALGMLNGLSELSEKLTDSTLQMVRNIPHLALIPLVIPWLGIGEEAKLFLVALGVLCSSRSTSTRCTVSALSIRICWRWPVPMACRTRRSSGASSSPARCPRSSSACATA